MTGGGKRRHRPARRNALWFFTRVRTPRLAARTASPIDPCKPCILGLGASRARIHVAAGHAAC
jgi:hypothetical protein